MAFDPVPLAIGQGAAHTDDVFRVAANIFSRDSQGVALPGQMKVAALGTPGAAVTIAPGGVVIRNVQNPGQSYVGRAATSTQVSIAANATGSVRRDLIIARIIDPDFSPWQPSGSPGAPNVSVADGPYFEPFVVSGVASGTTKASQVVGYSAVELARVDVPANTSAITSGMIVDLRALAQPRIGFAYDVQTGPAVGQALPIPQAAFVDYPTNSLSVYVPRFATHAQVMASVSLSMGGPANADFRTNFAGVAGPIYPLDYNYTPAGNLGAETLNFLVYGEFLVTAVQDSTVVLKTQARRTLTTTGVINFDTQNQIAYDVRFSERVI